MVRAAILLTLHLHVARAFVPSAGGPAAASPGSGSPGSGTRPAAVSPGSGTDSIEAASGESSASQCWVDEQAAALLQRFGSSYEPRREKTAAYDNLLMSPSATRILDACVASVDAAAEARRWPVRVPSRRVALGCYARALDALADESCDVSTGYEVYGDCRRSRLLDIFRELKDEGGAVGIYGLEGGIASK